MVLSERCQECPRAIKTRVRHVGNLPLLVLFKEKLGLHTILMSACALHMPMRLSIHEQWFKDKYSPPFNHKILSADLILAHRAGALSLLTFFTSAFGHNMCNTPTNNGLSAFRSINL